MFKKYQFLCIYLLIILLSPDTLFTHSHTYLLTFFPLSWAWLSPLVSFLVELALGRPLRALCPKPAYGSNSGGVGYPADLVMKEHWRPTHRVPVRRPFASLVLSDDPHVCRGGGGLTVAVPASSPSREQKVLFLPLLLVSLTSLCSALRCSVLSASACFSFSAPVIFHFLSSLLSAPLPRSLAFVHSLLFGALSWVRLQSHLVP